MYCLQEYEPSEGLSEARKRYREELKVWQNSLTTQQELEIKMLKQQRQKRLAKLRNQKVNLKSCPEIVEDCV